MKIVGTALLALLGLLLGAVAGGMIGAVLGFAWMALQKNCDASCAIMVLVTTPVGMVIGGLGGAWLLASREA